MKEKNYSNYTATELLSDDYFLESEHQPTQKSLLFWAQLEAEHETLAREMAYARSLLHAVAHSSQQQLSQQEVRELWNQIEIRTIAKQKRTFYRHLRRWGAVAACIALLSVGGWMSLTQRSEEKHSLITSVKRPDTVPTDETQLILSDAHKLTVEGEESELLYKKGTVDINSGSVQIEEQEGAAQAYNQLIVPAGKRSSVTFHDGTKVWVNANTRVVYPVHFATDRREIYVEGEVYLEVSPDRERPFIVKTNQLDVRVLGTKFNVNAYTENQGIVLVSGSVEVDTHRHDTQKLKPNEMLVYNSNGLHVQTVNVNSYISWINGYCLFEKEKVSTVITKLSQYYNKQINVSSALKEITCSGKLNLRDRLEEVLETLAETIPAQIEKTENGTFLIK